MYSCPACGNDAVAGFDICGCGVDLSLLRDLAALGDGWFNAGLAAAAKHEPACALEWISACCIARPGDAAAHLARARLWAQLGHFDQAQLALDRAAGIDPGTCGLAEVRAALAAIVDEKHLCPTP